jgi:hypothetical protein
MRRAEQFALPIGRAVRYGSSWPIGPGLPMAGLRPFSRLMGVSLVANMRGRGRDLPQGTRPHPRVLSLPRSSTLYGVICASEGKEIHLITALFSPKSAWKKKSSRKLTKQAIQSSNHHPSFGVQLDEGPAGESLLPLSSPLRALTLLTWRLPSRTLAGYCTTQR